MSPRARVATERAGAEALACPLNYIMKYKHISVVQSISSPRRAYLERRISVMKVSLKHISAIESIFPSRWAYIRHGRQGSAEGHVRAHAPIR